MISTAERLGPVDLAAISPAPDWVCEVLSPSTEQIDRTLKMPIYARAASSICGW